MKLKIDENLARGVRDELVRGGHDVATVPEQSLTSATDEALIEACRMEERALVTLDLDFANPLRFPPERYPGSLFSGRRHKSRPRRCSHWREP